MVCCSAYGCSNRTDRHKSSQEDQGDGIASGSNMCDSIAGDHGTGATGVSACDLGKTGLMTAGGMEGDDVKKAHLSEKITVYSFPKSGPLREKWIAAFNRDKKFLTPYSRLCSAHFEPSCFEDSYWLKFELGLVPKTRKLKTGAVPSIFVKPQHTSSPKPRLHTEERLRKRQRKEDVSEMMSDADTGALESFNVQPAEDNTEDSQICCSHQHKHVQTMAEVRVSKKSIGVGAYIDARVQPKVQMHDASTQTITEDAIIYNVHGSPWKVRFDHTYTRPIHPVPYVPHPECSRSDSEEDMESEVEISDDVNGDPTWEPHDLDMHEDEEDDTDQVNDEDAEFHMTANVNPASDKKFIIFASHLEELLKFCPNCGTLVLEKKMHIKGTLLTVELSCANSHDIVWRSQPLVNQLPMGNIILSAACLFSGSTYTRLFQIAKFMGLQVHSPGTFFKHQRNLLFPVIAGAWKRENHTVMNELASREQGITLIGDGRCDSPGYSAKYGTYTVMDSATSKIASFEVIQVSEVSSSVAMEKEGLKRVLAKLDKADPPVKINTIATDRHIQIAKFLEKEHPDKLHQFDVWHFSKNVTARLREKATKTKKYSILKPWIQFISNHLWWSSATCGGDAQQLRERWTSVVHHITDVHEWDSGKVYHRCAHEPLNEEERGEKLWLKPGSDAHRLLQDVVFDKRLLEAVEKLTDFCHTGPLEVAHSLYLKYCPKRQHFSYEGMVARTMLAALDNNRNVGRPQATMNTGEKRYNLVFPKGRKRWVAKPVMECKDYSHIHEMIDSVGRLCAGNVSPHEIGQINVPKLAQNIASQPRPNKVEVVANQKSRMVLSTSNDEA